MAKNYSEKDIERFAGLAGIRKKSTVYIGPNDSNGLWTILREPCDNAVDLALKNLNKLVHIVFDKETNKYWVLDDGPGFPVGVKKFEDERGRAEKLSTFYVATGLTHAGSNFDSDEISRGTHGIGIKATNAMSKLFKVWTFRDNKWWSIEYRDSKLKQDVKKDKAPKLPHGVKAKRGSVICFEPDLSLFVKGSKINLSDVMEWCTLTSYLVPGITVKLTTKKGKTKTYKTKGIGEYITARLDEEKATQYGKTFVHHDRFCDVAVAFANAENNAVRAYTNGLFNVDGGEHVKAVFYALVKALKPYKGKADYKPTDLRDGVVALINAKIAAPKFSNQRKDGLLDDRIYKPVFESTFKAFEDFFKKHKSLAKEIVRRASELRKKTADFLKDKKLLKNVKSASKALSAKLADVSGKTPVEERELFIVEGDSAGGLAKAVRNKQTQAVFSIRGKPLNVMDAQKDKINANKEVTGILAAIGIGQDKDKNKIRYGKIILMADPDIDGSHINTLLLALFWRFTPHLFKEKKIFILKAPEFFSTHKGKTYFGDTPEDIYKQSGTEKMEIRHVKGFGELSADKIETVAFDVAHRKLVLVHPPEDKIGRKQFEQLMGKDPHYRQQLLGV